MKNPDILNPEKPQEIPVQKESIEDNSQFISNGILIDPMKWATHPDQAVRLNFSKAVLNKVYDAPVEILEIISDYGDKITDYNILKQKNITLEIINKIVDRRIDDGYFISSLVSGDPYDDKIEHQVLFKILDFWNEKNSAFTIRSRTIKKIIMRGLATETDLIKYSEDKDPIVRAYVAAYEKTPKNVLEKLSDDCFDVKMFLAVNPALPYDLVVKLSNDPNSDIRRVVSLKTIPEDQKALLQTDRTSYLFGVPDAFEVAINPNTELSSLLKLIDHEDLEVRVAVASHVNITPEALAMLSSDSSSRVRRAVSLNPNTSIETLLHLTGDKNTNVLCGVLSNPNTTMELINKISEIAKNRKLYRIKYLINDNKRRLQKL